ncbi:MAG: diaminopimelate epimerase [Flavobacteriales bacterium]|nr:MAG: diaminopimelate epimerase [Flavobacteriales bacterium]
MKQNKIQFYKYHGTGNDFIMIDNRDFIFPKNDVKLIEHLCHRRFGIGADGLILLENDPDLDFKMTYFNSDGNESTMCGNGGRCLVAFAHFLGIFKDKCAFNAIDGIHEAEFKNGIVKLKMIPVEEITQNGKDFVLDTGSPHFVRFVDEVENFEVYLNGKAIRYSDAFKKEGINVNFVERISENQIFVRTYERGVEDETYSCGTGVTASCLSVMSMEDISALEVKTLGGNLKVYADKVKNGFENIWLEGPAIQSFEGSFNIEE